MKHGHEYPVGGFEAVAGSMPSAAQITTIQALREAVMLSEELRAHEAEARPYVQDDRLLHRFLTARKYDVDEAGKMLRRHLVWRFNTYRPFDITCQEMESYARTGRCRFQLG